MLCIASEDKGPGNDLCKNSASLQFSQIPPFLSNTMHRKRTFGGKRKYKFEPNIDGQDELSPVAAHEASAPAQQKAISKSPEKQQGLSTRKVSFVALQEKDAPGPPRTSYRACEMVFKNENEPQCIGPVAYDSNPFDEDQCFIIEGLCPEDGDFVVYKDRTCAFVAQQRSVSLVPVPGEALIAVVLGEEAVEELGVASQSYVPEEVYTSHPGAEMSPPFN